MAERTKVRYGGAPLESVATDFVLQFGLPQVRLNERWW
jgi:hypothetical protein